MMETTWHAAKSNYDDLQYAVNARLNKVIRNVINVRTDARK